MLKDLRFPLLYLTEALLFLPTATGFFGVASFLGAKPISGINLHGKVLPSTWEAAVFNHGRYLQGYLIGNHPAIFAAFLALFLASGIATHRVRLAQVAQASNAEPTKASAHKIANACVFGTWGVLGFVLVKCSFDFAVSPR
jgi:hypothetical protein